MDEMSKKIVKEIKDHKNGMTEKGLVNQTKLPAKDVKKKIKELKEQGMIHYNSHSKIFLNREISVIAKIVKKEDDFYGDIGEEQFPLTKVHLRGAKEGEYVLLKIHNYGLKTVEGVVLERLRHVFGRVYDQNGRLCIKNYAKHNFEIDIENPDGLIPGMVVDFEFTKPLKKNVYGAKWTKVRGHIDNPNTHLSEMLYSSGIDTTFPYEVIQASGKLPTCVTEEELKDRVDLRSELIFTIDGKDSKDFDDAISIRRLENGNYLLGVHIADVDHYVKESSILDLEAYKRGMSTYILDRVIPMLPHRLSNGICSLKEGVDRLTLTCEMEFSKSGDFVTSSLYKSVIHSQKRMTYEDVNRILENHEQVPGYQNFIESLELLHEWANLYHEKRYEHGAIEFDEPEPIFQYDKLGNPIHLDIRERKSAEKGIAEAMIAANTTVAHILKDYPVLLRSHRPPDNKELKRVIPIVEFLLSKKDIKCEEQELITSILEEIKLLANDTILPSRHLQLLLNLLKKYDTNNLISSYLLTTMHKANYTVDKNDHYGLGLDYYTHFTSPIRRYPDLVTHRLIKYSLLQIEQDCDKMNLLEDENKKISSHVSKREKQVRECGRKIDYLAQAQYLKQHINHIYDGYIGLISGSGLQVNFDKALVGKIPSFLMPNYHYEPMERAWVHNTTRERYELGDAITIKIANIWGKNVILEPVEEEKKLRLR